MHFLLSSLTMFLTLCPNVVLTANIGVNKVDKIDLEHSITKVIYMNHHGAIFVGGHNFISMLSSDLVVIFRLGIGPVLEAKYCFPHPAPCDNNVTVLEYDRFSNRILVCGTAYQGTCVLHDVAFQEYACVNAPPRSTANQISPTNTDSAVIQIFEPKWERSKNDGLSTFLECRSPDYGLEIFDEMPEQPQRFPGEERRRVRSVRAPLGADVETSGGQADQWITNPIWGDDVAIEGTDLRPWVYTARVLVASWAVPLETDSSNDTSQPIISLRKVSMGDVDFRMRFPDGQEASNTGIHVKPSHAKTFDSYFKYAFTEGNFTYVLSLRTKKCSSFDGKDRLCTGTFLSRINNLNASATPYMDIPLSCNHNGIRYELLLSAATGKFRTMEDNKVVEVLFLIVAFGKETLNSLRTPDPAYISAVCVFSLADLEEKVFAFTTDPCNDHWLQTVSPSWIMGVGDNCTEDYVEFVYDEALDYLAKVVPLNNHVLATIIYLPLLPTKDDLQFLNDRMHVYTVDQTGQIYKFSLVLIPDLLKGYDVRLTPAFPEHVYDVSASVKSPVPSTCGATSHVRALTYLAFGTQLVAFSLDFCRQYTTCSTCRQHVRKCGWCAEFHLCLSLDDFKMQCRTHTETSCPPELTDFYPKDVPVSGGSTITLLGHHLGSPGGGLVQVKMCSRQCLNVKPNKNTLQCTVPARCDKCPSKCDVDITVNQKESSGSASSRNMPVAKQLTYVVPRLISISPTSGPLLGLNTITIKGEHLRAGTNMYLEVLKARCTQPSEGRETSKVICRMQKAEVDARGQCGPVTLHIDNHVSTTNDTEYCFKDDPTIQSVEPTATLIDGGLTLTVTGTDFDIVAGGVRLLLIAKIDTERGSPKFFQSDCRKLTATNMTCEIPPLSDLEKPLADVEHVEGYLAVSMTFYVYTESNRVSLYMNMSSEFQIYSMPYFDGVTEGDKWSYIYLGLKDNLYTFPGRNIPTWLRPGDIDITVGETPCPVKVIMSSRISCDVTDILEAYRQDLEAHNKAFASSTSNSTSNLTSASSSSPDSADSNAVDKRKLPLELVEYPGGDLKPATLRPSLTRDEFMIKKERNGTEFFYRLKIQIGSHRRILGYVRVGHKPEEIVTPPPEVEIETAGVDLVVVVGAIVGSLVLFLLVMICACCLCVARIRRKRRARMKRPSFLYDLGSTPQGSNESSVPSLPQILELELGPAKKGEISNLLIGSDRLLVGKTIGSGNFGRVYEGMLAPKLTETPMKVAIKTLQDPVSHVINLREFVKEAIIMVGFQHPHVLGLVGLAEKELGVPYVILPYMDNGDLLTYVRDPRRMLSLYDVIQFGADICSGMAYLSSVKLVHRDLAARNCMLDHDFRVKVADFGLCRDIYEKGYYTSSNKKKLPVRWMAIESIERGAYSTKSDVWSMGVVLWEMLTRGVTPYPGVDGWDIINFLRKRRLPPPHFCPDELYRLMMSCWVKDPEKRLTFNILHRELIFLIGQEPDNEATTTSAASPTQRVKGQPRERRHVKIKTPGGSNIGGSAPTPKIEIMPGSIRMSESQGKVTRGMWQGVEPGRVQEMLQPTIEEDEISCLSMPQTQTVENVVITFPDCHSNRNISKAEALTYLKLVDNYEPTPKFSNPFNRSKKKRHLSEMAKSGSRKERYSFSRSKSEVTTTTTNVDASRFDRDSYLIPFQNRGASPAMSNETYSWNPTPGDRLEVSEDIGHENNGSKSSRTASMMPQTGSIRAARDYQNVGPDSPDTSAGYSYQHVASPEDGTDPNYSLAKVSDRPSVKNDLGPAQHHSWKKRETELRSREPGDRYDRLSGWDVGPGTSPDYHAIIDDANVALRRLSTVSNDSESSTNYQKICEAEVTSRPDSKTDNYHRISVLEDTSAGNQVWGKPYGHDGEIITSL